MTPSREMMLRFLTLVVTLVAASNPSPGAFAAEPRQWVAYEGKQGPGKGKHVVFLTGDEEYRGEEGLPQLAKILAEHHGFRCTVLFSIDKATGAIDPNVVDNEPGIEALDSADLCVMLLRHRHWPDAQMKHFVDYYLSGKPIIALRTSTHAFSNVGTYARYHWQSKDWPGGFGKQVLGETWVSHWGKHKSQATGGVIEAAAKEEPILRGVADIFGDTDVYEAHPPADVAVLVRGAVLQGMNRTDPPIEGKKNDPMQPIVWTRAYKNEAGKTNKILTTTMGSATDILNEGLRRIIANGAYWALGLEIPTQGSKVDLVGEYKPTMYGFKGFIKGVKPADHALEQK